MKIKMAYFSSVMNPDCLHCGCWSAFDCLLLNEPASREVGVYHSAEQQTDEVAWEEGD